MNLKRITSALLRAARIGAEVSLNEQASSTVGFKASRHPSNFLVALGSRIVTSADYAVQEAILECLLDEGLEDCGVEAEENTRSLQRFRARAGAPIIFIDPIDGTLAFAMGCPRWESAAIEAGFPQDILDTVKSRLDSRFYGIVLGALVPGSSPIAVCVLPSLGITYHAVGETAYRNGQPLKLIEGRRTTSVAIDRRLVDADGVTASLFETAGIQVRAYTGSNPGTLWNIFEGDCTAYAGLVANFDAQLASIVARTAGLLIADRNGRDFVAELSGPVSGLVFASSAMERDQICAVLQRYS